MDEATGQYYLHLFAKEQADLNWENPVVREEVKEVISFWADKGVDGFRLDVINLISKQQDFPSDDIGDGRRFYTDGPRVHEYLQEISEAVFQKYGSVTVEVRPRSTGRRDIFAIADEARELSHLVGKFQLASGNGHQPVQLVSSAPRHGEGRRAARA